MYDRELVIEILTQIQTAAKTILLRFEPVKTVSDFTSSQGGMEKLDSICMLLSAIGESIKNLDKITNGELFFQYPQVDWKKAKALRDIIVHHYFDLNAEAIFDICQTKMRPLLKTIERIIEDLNSY